MLNKYDFIDVPTTPNAENCAQVGMIEDYRAVAAAEMIRMRKLIYQIYDELIPQDFSFNSTFQPHDFGAYAQLQARWPLYVPEEFNEAEQFALFLESDNQSWPDNWEVSPEETEQMRNAWVAYLERVRKEHAEERAAYLAEQEEIVQPALDNFELRKIRELIQRMLSNDNSDDSSLADDYYRTKYGA